MKSILDLQRLLKDEGVTKAQILGGDHATTISRMLKNEAHAAFFVTGMQSSTLHGIRHVKGLHMIHVQAAPWRGVAEQSTPANAVAPSLPASAVKSLYTPAILVASNQYPAAAVWTLGLPIDKTKLPIEQRVPLVAIEPVSAALGLPLHAGER